MSIELDRKIISALIHGNNKAWIEIGICIERWLIHASARHFIPDADIQDLRQEILEKLLENNYSKLQQFSFRCRLSTWVGSVVNNHLYDNYTSSIRRERREMGFESFKQNVFIDENESEYLIDKIDTQERVEKALETLTPSEHRTIRMIYWDSLNPVDIARVSGENSTTITSRITRARKKLREFFLEGEVEEEKAI
ncbi:sigma-70 family RNA polymerase sigma factor [bacterium]|nr:sigma-70 family RNA polymerase sigma factor [bacterium]MBU1024615.1 sigma-70 family RNA polymerase sigma factor [bacterium]